MAQPIIPTYYSHSYRPEDREINRLFMGYFWRRGFAFTVDPGAIPLSTTQLAVMMRDSACFVAVATWRPDVPKYLCSPFIVYEYGLALQANKPRLVIAESGIAEHYFPESKYTVRFSRDRLLANGDPVKVVEGLVPQATRLANASRAYAAIGDRMLGRVGVIVPSTGPYARAGAQIEALLWAAGYSPVRPDLRSLSAVEAAILFDDLDFVVLELSVASTRWVLPFLHGRCIPALWLRYKPPGTADEPVPPLLGSEILRDATAGGAGSGDQVVRWSTEEDLARAFTGLWTPRRHFRSLAEGEKYLASLGRSADDSVFLSSAGQDRELAREISLALELKNVPMFHYEFQSAQLPLGEPWEDKLDDLVRQSRLFVPLVSKHYRDSPYCQRELAAAEKAESKGQLKIIPYYLGRSGVSIKSEGRTLDPSEPPADQAADIAEEIDRELIKAAKSPHSITPAPQTARRRSRPARVDIALLTILPEEYDAMCEQVEDRERYIGTRKEPNRCDWITGRIPNSTYGHFRVVVGMVKKGTLGALVNTHATINIFRPDNVIIVGIAGAIDPKLNKGDVVVAEHIYGYEYGAVGSGGFEPRPDWTWPTDPALATMARNVNRRHPQWRALIKGSPPDRSTRQPQISVGAIASGNKVVDDLEAAAFRPVLDHWKSLVAIEMEAAGACEAVQEALQRKQLVQFSSVRGISDKPLSSADSSAAAAKPGSRAGQTAERDNWKPYASATAAAFTRFLIGDLWPQPPRK